MPATPAIQGSLLRTDRPEWAPLERLVGTDLSGYFMWTHATELTDGCEVHAYKHAATRRYLHLALDGTPFLQLEGDYHQISEGAALREAFRGWERMLQTTGDAHLVRSWVRRSLARARSRTREAA